MVTELDREIEKLEIEQAKKLEEIRAEEHRQSILQEQLAASRHASVASVYSATQAPDID